MHSSQNILIQQDNDIKKVLDLISRNYKFFIICIIISFGIAVLLNQFSKPVYKVSSSLLIKEESRQQQGGNSNDFLNSSLLGTNQNFQNELWVLNSNPVIEQTIKNLDLAVNYYHKKGFQYLDAYENMPFRVILL